MGYKGDSKFKGGEVETVTGTKTKPVVKFVIFEDAVASLWAAVPQFGIGPGFDWCVGGALLEDAHEKAVEELRREIEEHCANLINDLDLGIRPVTATEDRMELARQVVRDGFELVEDTSIPTYWDKK